jgi:predicted nuclease of predicted toxin-antitoxin system
VSEEDLIAAKDKEIAVYCAQNSFAILTRDDDFLSLSQAVELDFEVIYIRQRINFKKMKQRIKKLQKEKLRGSSIVYL